MLVNFSKNLFPVLTAPQIQLYKWQKPESTAAIYPGIARAGVISYILPLCIHKSLTCPRNSYILMSKLHFKKFLSILGLGKNNKYFASFFPIIFCILVLVQNI